MSVSYVTLAEQKEYSKIQHTAIDTTIGLLIQAASAAVKNYLKDFSPYQAERDEDDDYIVDSNFEPVILLDSGGNKEVKAEVKLAVMLEVDRRINRKSVALESEFGYLANDTVALLYPLRDPALQ